MDWPLCACGCGNPAPIATITINRLGIRKGEPRMYVRGHFVRGRRGPDAPGWKGGKGESVSGYISHYTPDHPRTSTGHVHEHVLVVERALGHYLPSKANIHHIDENRSNNSPGNLVACEDFAYHMLLHKRARAFDACGNANAYPCQYCGSYERQDDMRVFARKGRKSPLAEHRECVRAYEKRRPPRIKHRS